MFIRVNPKRNSFSFVGEIVSRLMIEYWPTGKVLGPTFAAAGFGNGNPSMMSVCPKLPRKVQMLLCVM